MPTRNSRPRLLAYAKISDYQVEKIAWHFARGDSPTLVAAKMKPSYVTIRRLYELIRNRLIEIAYFSPIDIDQASDQDDQDRLERQLDQIDEVMRKRRGVTARTRPQHQAELLFRLEEGGGKPGDLYPDMMRALRLSGQLNRPITDRGRMRAKAFLINRTLDKRMSKLLLNLERSLPINLPGTDAKAITQELRTFLKGRNT